MNRSHERDEAVERLLRQSFRNPQQRVTDSCLDPETIAAWLDGGLTGAALTQAQTHVADCARCQELTGALVRAGVILREPDPVTPRRWLRWLVPLTATATAIAIWIAVPRDREAPVPPAALEQSRDARLNAPALPQTAPGQEPPPAARDSSRSSLQDKATQPYTASGEARTNATAGAGQGADQVQTFDARRDADRAEADELRQQQSKAAGELAASGARERAASPAPPAAARTPVPEEQEAASARSAAALEGSVGSVTSSDRAVLWRVARSGVERSTDGGATWSAVPTGVATELTAAASPSASVCWVVGRAGVVLLSTDGHGFSRLAFPERTDLSSIQATDARSASVTTEDGRVFQTIDGGQTWTRR